MAVSLAQRFQTLSQSNCFAGRLIFISHTFYLCAHHNEVGEPIQLEMEVKGRNQFLNREMKELAEILTLMLNHRPSFEVALQSYLYEENRNLMVLSFDTPVRYASSIHDMVAQVLIHRYFDTQQALPVPIAHSVKNSGGLVLLHGGAERAISHRPVMRGMS